MAVERVVVKRNLCVEADKLVGFGEDKRVDLQKLMSLAVNAP